MADIIIILTAWYLKAFSDAIKFAKSEEPCHEVWHVVDWIRSWIVPVWFMYRIKMSVWHIIPIVILAFAFNTLYKLFRHCNIYKLDDRYRIKWLGKIFESDGIV